LAETGDVVLVVLTRAGQTNYATTLDLFLPTSGDRPSYVERRDGLSWLCDDDDDDDCKEATLVLNNSFSRLHTGTALIQEPWAYKKCTRGLNIRNARILYDTNCDIPRACILTLGAVQARILKQYTSRDVVTATVTLHTAEREGT